MVAKWVLLPNIEILVDSSLIKVLSNTSSVPNKSLGSSKYSWTVPKHKGHTAHNAVAIRFDDKLNNRKSAFSESKLLINHQCDCLPSYSSQMNMLSRFLCRRILTKGWDNTLVFIFRLSNGSMRNQHFM